VEHVGQSEQSCGGGNFSPQATDAANRKRMSRETHRIDNLLLIRAQKKRRAPGSKQGTKVLAV
jgi:hypothetical protein